MRTLIYARYSSDLQNSRSVDDQIAVCAERAEREGWEVVAVYTDAAISGARGTGELQRPGLHAMMARIEAGGIDQIMAESTSRLARHEGDSFALREKLRFHEVRLFTLGDGVVDDFRGSIRAIIDAQARRDIAANVRRGQRGTVASGRVAAGLAYGYRVANEIASDGRFIRGLRAVDEDQADVVRRIFARYAEGRSARQIALELNAEGIAGPTGGLWTASTIQGDRKRGNGLLKNALYVGRIVHNRTRKVQHPETRSELIRPNDLSAHAHGSAPHLRIVTDELFDQVQTALDRRSHGPKEAQRRPKHLLSGLMVCGQCGARLITTKPSTWACSGYRYGKGCRNSRTINTAVVHTRLMDALVNDLAAPEAVQAYLEEYAGRRAARATGLMRERERLSAAHAEASARVERLIEAVANGADEFEEVRDMIRRARTERDNLAAELRSVESVGRLTIGPGLARNYRAQLADLARALEDPVTTLEAAPLIRALIDRIVTTPREGGRGMEITVEGRLANLLLMAAGEPISGAPARLRANG